MDTKELLAKVRAIEIKTRGLSKQVFSGEYHSAFKGRGMAFSEVKDYNYGDDVRNIDWNVTARFNEPFVKVFEEERELTVMLILDVSGSGDYGTVERSKKELMLEISAILGFSAANNNDKVGAIFVSEKMEKFIPPKKGRAHILRILRELIDFKPELQGTDINEGLKFFRNVVKKRSIAFVVSDFIDENDFIEGLKIANRKHDMVALRIVDPAERELPNVGIVQLYDAEKGVKRWVHTGLKSVRAKFRERFQKFEEKLLDGFRKAGVDYAVLSTHGSYIGELNRLFMSRRK
jgi:uncharacterized protein (DUF58 family)